MTDLLDTIEKLKDVIKLEAPKEGPTSIILAAVHGNEKVGLKALKQILPDLDLDKGEVFFGCGNPKAAEENKRYTEANLNRLFISKESLSEKQKNSYEFKRANYLREYLDKSEALLDLHASSIPDSTPFIICEENAKEIVKYLPVSFEVSGFDKLEPGGTDHYMNKSGKVGICVECGTIGDSKTAKLAKQSVFSFLKARGHLEKKNNSEEKNTYIRMYKKYYTKTDNFKLEKEFKNFESLKKGQLIGQDGDEKIRADKDCIILFAHSRNEKGKSAFLLGKKNKALL